MHAFDEFFAEGFEVCRCGGAVVDHEVAMFLGHEGAADFQAAATDGVDDLPDFCAFGQASLCDVLGRGVCEGGAAGFRGSAGWFRTSS